MQPTRVLLKLGVRLPERCAEGREFASSWEIWEFFPTNLSKHQEDAQIVYTNNVEVTLIVQLCKGFADKQIKITVTSKFVAMAKTEWFLKTL